MTELEQSAFFADLEAELAALDDAASSKDLWLLKELEAIGNAGPCAEARPGFVADGQACDVRNPLENKVTSGQVATLHQVCRDTWSSAYLRHQRDYRPG
jgi:hypothetical protein